MLAEPETQSDNNRFRDLSQEYAQIEPIVQSYTAFVDNENELESAQEMLDDPEMAELAQESIREAEDIGRARSRNCRNCCCHGPQR